MRAWGNGYIDAIRHPAGHVRVETLGVRPHLFPRTTALDPRAHSTADTAVLLRRIEALEAENRRLRDRPADEALREALDDSEQRYRSFFQSIDEGFCVIEMIVDGRGEVADYRFVETNAVFEVQSGMAGVVGRTVREVVPDVEAAWFERYGRVAATGAPMRLVERSDALDRWFDIYAFRTGAAEQRRVAVLFKDVSDQQRDQALARTREQQLNAEAMAHAQALRDLEDFSRLALSAVGGVGVWRFDVATDRFFCDANIARLYAIDPVAGEAGILREDFLANVLDEDKAALRATMAGGLVNAGDLELEYRVRHADGSVHWVLSRGHTYFDDAGKPLRRTGVGVEMTKQRLLEEQLRQSQKLEAIGQLTGGIAHDFNNMLSTISTSVELLRRRIPVAPPEELERYLGMSARAVRSAASLTHRLLAFSRKQTLDIRAVDANRLAREMEELLRRTLGERVALSLQLVPAPWLAQTDPHQLENALLNLAINARDAMPDGGRLVIATDNVVVKADDRARPAELAAGEYLAVAVSDTGTGMPPEVVARAFDPFFTTKPIGQGTGLGLSMIYGFVKQSGGHVAIDSAPGAGTTVRLLLPRAGSADETIVARASTEVAPRGTGEHVLVVEDEPDVRRVVVDVLVERGYRTTEAADADAALALLASDIDFDLLLTDVGLPGMTGRELADRARLQRPALKALFMTGYAKEAAVRAEFLGNGMDMIAKPFAVEDLVGRVHAMTRR